MEKGGGPIEAGRFGGLIMRLLVTVVCPAIRQSADVVLEADAATPMAAVAAELERFAAGGRGRAGAGGGEAGRRRRFGARV